MITYQFICWGRNSCYLNSFKHLYFHIFRKLYDGLKKSLIDVCVARERLVMKRNPRHSGTGGHLWGIHLRRLVMQQLEQAVGHQWS